MCGTDVKENNITTADENLPKSIMCSIAHLKSSLQIQTTALLTLELVFAFQKINSGTV